jgi:hypothetical protein
VTAELLMKISRTFQFPSSVPKYPAMTPSTKLHFKPLASSYNSSH